ncbi:TPA: hypothetical protein EYP38_03020, partial [Candidatus Micrarchaeota archaeon]|nr:hypothetical protein [Candidatus Micrarchaeota archaeon]
MTMAIQIAYEGEYGFTEWRCSRWALACLLVCPYILLALVLILIPRPAPAQESYCAEVQIRIQQELTLERQAFDAHMRINNGLVGIAVEDVAIDVKFTDADGNAVLATSDP